jgi:hypothetical protein
VANYVKATNFAVKDSLLTGNPAKLVKGTEIDTEFNAIATAISSKLDSGTDLTIAGKYITSSAGTVSAPIFTLSTDPNTGIFFPAADEMSITAGGFEMIHVDNTGSGTRYVDFLCNLRTEPDVEATIESGRFSSAVGGSVFTTIGSSTFLALQVEDVTRVEIKDTGNVGIGTSSPSTRLHVANSGADAYIRAEANSISCQMGVTNSGQINFTGAPGTGLNMAIGTTNSTAVSVATNNSVRMNVRSDGEVWIMNTSDQGAYNLQVGGTGVWGAGAYVNGSDARLKEDIQSIASGLDVVAAMRPVTFKYKEDYSKDQSIQTGFIAQELKEVLKDTNYVDGIVQQGPEYLNVAYQNIIPLLTKAIQELKAELDEVKATLKGN